MPTNIEWTDETWSPVTGCTNISPGCGNCYAEKITNRFKRHAWGQVTLHPDRLGFPNKLKRPSKVFICSMGDLFHSAVPWEFIVSVFDVMLANPQHTFQVLTKRPGRMMHFGNSVWPKHRGLSPQDAWPSNIWAGTSVENQRYAARLDLLAQVPAAVRFVSYEPALGPVDFWPWLEWCRICFDRRDDHDDEGWGHKCQAVDLVIAGGESGPGARPPHPGWFRSVRDQCVEAGVSFFFKQWGGHRPVADEPVPPRMILVNPDGSVGRMSDGTLSPGYHAMVPVSKKAAGALLDGREWREFPTAVAKCSVSSVR